ncbi:MAG: hypothetical protein NZM09_07385 [Ignavibacterium sp.]|nr:hypothetical protein [Ignavibacterium sp.]MDW8375505.1 hypothetical protein [Ignavibacteriales bacterium]
MKYINKAGMLSFQLFIFFSVLIFPQTSSNLDIFRNLTDSLTNKIFESLRYKTTSIQIISQENNQLNYLNDQIRSNFIKNNLMVRTGEDVDEILILNFSEASVEYPELFKEHIFGKYFLTRKITLSGIVILLKKSETFDFNFTSLDTIEYSEYSKFENKLLPFTIGQPPKEPFFSNLIEPIIAISATATAVILFFTVRSK